ncbi:flagellar motor protein MotB, partial [Enterobacter cloacae]
NQQAEQAILHENAESQNESLDDLKQPGAVPSAAVPTSPPANPR